MFRAVGCTFIGEGTTGNKITAPFVVSEVSAGTNTAIKLMVGNEIVQIGNLRGMFRPLPPATVTQWKKLLCENTSLLERNEVYSQSFLSVNAG